MSHVKNTYDIGPDILEYASMSAGERAGPRAMVIRDIVRTKYKNLVHGTSEAFKKRETLPVQLRDLEDLNQAGYEGLLVALDRYDPLKSGYSRSEGRKFTSTATLWVRYLMQVVIEKAQGAVYEPRSSAMPYKLRRVGDRIKAEFGRPPTPAELGISQVRFDRWEQSPKCVSLASRFRVSSSKLSREGSRPLSLDEVAEPAIGTGLFRPLSETLPGTVPDPEATVEDAELRQELTAVMATITDADIVRAHVVDGLSFAKIAKSRGLTEEQVQFRYEDALEELRDEL